MPPAQCGPGAWPAPYRWTGECVYDARDAAGLAAGLLSILAWMGAQAPQVLENARTRSAAALSPAFLAEWLAGDTCNLIGCLLAADTGGALRTQTATAAYFIAADCVLILQYVVYGALSSGRGGSVRRQRAYVPRRQVSAAALAAAGVVQSAAAAGTPPPLPPPPPVGRRAAAVPSTSPPSPTPPPVAGPLIAWVSAAFYLSSRIAQLAKNAARGSAAGLSTSMFCTAVCANVLYGGSILARARSREALLAAAPWLAGSLGTVTLDVCILIQASVLTRRNAGGGRRRRGSGDGEAGPTTSATRERRPLLAAE